MSASTNKPLLKFERILETYLAFCAKGLRLVLRAMPRWLKGKMHATRELGRGLDGRYTRRFVFSTHHESHAASAFFHRLSRKPRSSHSTASASGRPQATEWDEGTRSY